MVPCGRLSLLIIAAALCAGASPAASQAAVGDEIIVKRSAGLTAGERGSLRADADVRLGRALPLRDVELVTARPGRRAGALRSLQAHPDVVWAEPNHERRLFTADPYWAEMWGLDNRAQTVWGVTGTADADIDAPEAWVATKGAGVTVAVVDTGVQPGHPDLSTVPGRDFVDGDAEPADGHGHGTHVAGTVAALENADGVVGVAPQARVMALRVLDDSGRGTAADIASAFSYAGQQGVRVVNASLGADSSSFAEREAIRLNPNTLYVVAAGNDTSDNDARGVYPCAYDLPNVVCVGASDSRDQPAVFSNYGRVTVDLHAPGVDILSTHLTSAYAYLDGTSMASPHAAGVAALVAARNPALGASAMRTALLAGADDVASLAGLSATGGRLNAVGTLQAAGLPPEAPLPVEPAPTPTPTPAPTPVSPPPALEVSPVLTPPATLGGVRVTGRVVVCSRGCRPRSGKLRFDLRARAAVKVSLERATCRRRRCTYRSAGSRTLALAAGSRTITVGARLAGMKLRSGSWRVTLRTPASRKRASFRVYAR